ncbi:hypothetical protein [Butyrivibrio sp. JL13D10]|uniref:hypothetical protein n=1 Tax=Butyrivibrio sp. JL13D10 TaxID=3236815 RepID=UPI0038B43C1F
MNEKKIVIEALILVGAVLVGTGIGFAAMSAKLNSNHTNDAEIVAEADENDINNSIDLNSELAEKNEIEFATDKKVEPVVTAYSNKVLDSNDLNKIKEKAITKDEVKTIAGMPDVREFVKMEVDFNKLSTINIAELSGISGLDFNVVIPEGTPFILPEETENTISYKWIASYENDNNYLFRVYYDLVVEAKLRDDIEEKTIQERYENLEKKLKKEYTDSLTGITYHDEELFMNGNKLYKVSGAHITATEDMAKQLNCVEGTKRYLYEYQIFDYDNKSSCHISLDSRSCVQDPKDYVELFTNTLIGK